jgi:molecular chaperone DnaK
VSINFLTEILGQFNLVGIPPAPRGVPQIEVTFDIDADGIVNVSAKDKATNKDQSSKDFIFVLSQKSVGSNLRLNISVTLAASSGLSDAEIDKMVTESEKFAEADKKRKEVIEESNKAESIIHDTEKSMSDFKDQLDKEEAEKIRSKISDLRAYLAEGADKIEAESVKEKYGELQQASLKLFEMVYKKKQGESTTSSGESSTVDAEFKDANEKKDK